MLRLRCLLLLTLVLPTLSFAFLSGKTAPVVWYRGHRFHAASPSEQAPLESTTAPLPPGRPTSKVINIFFDDTASLLSPRDMKLLKRKKKFGPIFKTNFLFQPTVFVSDNVLIQQLARQEAVKELKAFFPPHHRTLFGPNSLLVQSGPAHQRMRNLIMSSMTPAMISSYELIVEDSIKALFQDNKSTEYIEMVPRMRDLFLSILLQVVLGTTDVSSELRSDIDLWARGLLAPPLTFIPWSTASKALRARARVVANLDALMDNPPNKGLMATLLQARDGDETLSRDEVLDNLFTLVFAGSDTTSSAAVSIWMTLSQKPQLVQELKGATSEQIESFVQSILEAFPPAPFQMRVTTQDLEVGGYRIPANWQVAYGYAAALHGSPPPLQLTPSSTSSSPASSSLAFGQGPRKCPGRYLAVMELKVFTKVLIDQKWEMDPDQNLEQTYTPGFFPVDRFRVKLGPD